MDKISSGDILSFIGGASVGMSRPTSRNLQLEGFFQKINDDLDNISNRQDICQKMALAYEYDMKKIKQLQEAYETDINILNSRLNELNILLISAEKQYNVKKHVQEEYTKKIENLKKRIKDFLSTDPKDKIRVSEKYIDQIRSARSSLKEVIDRLKNIATFVMFHDNLSEILGVVYAHATSEDMLESIASIKTRLNELEYNPNLSAIQNMENDEFYMIFNTIGPQATDWIPFLLDRVYRYFMTDYHYMYSKLWKDARFNRFKIDILTKIPGFEQLEESIKNDILDAVKNSDNGIISEEEQTRILTSILEDMHTSTKVEEWKYYPGVGDLSEKGPVQLGNSDTLMNGIDVTNIPNNIWGSTSTASEIPITFKFNNAISDKFKTEHPHMKYILPKLVDLFLDTYVNSQTQMFIDYGNHEKNIIQKIKEGIIPVSALERAKLITEEYPHYSYGTKAPDTTVNNELSVRYDDTCGPGLKKGPTGVCVMDEGFSSLLSTALSAFLNNIAFPLSTEYYQGGIQSMEVFVPDEADATRSKNVKLITYFEKKYKQILEKKNHFYPRPPHLPNEHIIMKDFSGLDEQNEFKNLISNILQCSLDVSRLNSLLLKLIKTKQHDFRDSGDEGRQELMELVTYIYLTDPITAGQVS